MFCYNTVPGYIYNKKEIMSKEMREQMNKMKNLLKEDTENLNVMETNDCQRVKELYDMTIDGFKYHLIKTEHDTKEELEEKIKWFYEWMNKVRSNMA
jgi:hypothetical protein